VNGSPATDVARTAYEVFLAELGREPTAAECEQWAVRHGGDPEEPRALVDAGWYAARGGESERALALFRRAAGFGGESGRDAQVGIVEQLYALRREQEADTAQRVLRAELDDGPGGRGDLRVFDDMAEMLSDAGKHELALEWCQAGLDRVAGAGDAAELADYRRGLLITRGFLRDELDIERDDEDLAVRAQSDASFAAFGKMVRETWGDLFGGRELELPDDGTAFDGIVLRWVRADFMAIRSRWPESTAHYGDNYETYALRLQREARGYDEAGAARVHIVSGNLADYEAYARRERRDPGDQSTRQDYGEWCLKAHPGRVQLWPPARNGVCWCDSGRKYKKCCGTPVRN
jgi:tetratricopeptide (TPR) repeat protein